MKCSKCGGNSFDEDGVCNLCGDNPRLIKPRKGQLSCRQIIGWLLIVPGGILIVNALVDIVRGYYPVAFGYIGAATVFIIPGWILIYYKKRNKSE
jgi:hypothetical protein